MDVGNLASGGGPLRSRARGSSDDASRPGPVRGWTGPLGRGRGLPRPGLVRPLPGEVGGRPFSAPEGAPFRVRAEPRGGRGRPPPKPQFTIDLLVRGRNLGPKIPFPRDGTVPASLRDTVRRNRLPPPRWTIQRISVGYRAFPCSSRHHPTVRRQTAPRPPFDKRCYDTPPPGARRITGTERGGQTRRPACAAARWADATLAFRKATRPARSESVYEGPDPGTREIRHGRTPHPALPMPGGGRRGAFLRPCP